MPTLHQHPDWEHCVNVREMANHHSAKRSASSNVLLCCLLGATLLLLQGCGTASAALQLMGLKDTPNELDLIEIEAAADCNHDMPVAMDILFLEDADLAGLLSELSGPEWFLRKRELLGRYGSGIKRIEFEIVPLTVKTIESFPAKHKQSPHVLLFANYLAEEGQYVAELANYKKLKILLHSDTYLLQELESEND